MPNDVRSKRGKYAQAIRWHGQDSQQATNSRRDLAEAQIEAYIDKILSEAPPLTAEQRTRLAELLRPARIDGDAA